MIYGYTRVSTSGQAGEDKSSLSDQEAKIRAAATIRGEQIADIFSDPGVSGSVPLFGRPAGQALAATIRPGDTIISAKMDRLFRSTSDALQSVEALQKRNIGVVLVDIGVDAVTESGTSKLFFSILAAVAEFERFRIAERNREGRRGKASRGGFIGGEAPYGYTVRGKGNSAVLETDQHEQRIVSLISDLRQSHSLRHVARELERRGLANRDGRPFHPQTIQRIMARTQKVAS
jgi:DNA invertase Pin-like site-specific DNA recombinase